MKKKNMPVILVDFDYLVDLISHRKELSPEELDAWKTYQKTIDLNVSLPVLSDAKVPKKYLTFKDTETPSWRTKMSNLYNWFKGLF